MFPITHIWFGEQVLGELDNQSVLGAIFPDMVISGCLEYNTTHKSGWKLYEFIKNNHPQYLGFARGTLTHGVDPKGLDYYGDEKFKSLEMGYCFQKAVGVTERVIKSCNIPESFGLWKAHNFIEMAIELEIYNRYPLAHEKMKKAMMDLEMIKKLCPVLEEFYGLSNGSVNGIIEHFGTFVELNQPSSETLAKKYDLQMKRRHNISINTEKSRVIIEDCRPIISVDMFDFFDYVNIKVGDMIRMGEENI